MSRKTDAKLKNDVSCSAFPQMFDDIEFSKDITVRIINSYTGCGESDTTAKKAHKLRAGTMLSTNFSLADIER